MIQADSVHSTPWITASKTNPPDQAPMTHDDKLGMVWWNALTKQERAKWSAIAGNTGRPKDAWEAFRRGSMDQSPPIDPTRRHFLTVAAGGAVAAAIPTATLTAAAAVDPVYAVIERHQKARAAHNEAIDIHMDFEEMGMAGEKLEKNKRLVAETDAAYDRLDDVGCDLINTKPMTLAGVLALCRYVKPFFGESDPDELPNHILYDDDSTEYPAEALFRVMGNAIEALINAQAEKAVQS
jgi:hypothetical protein